MRRKPLPPLSGSGERPIPCGWNALPGVWSELLQRVDDQYYSLASLYRQIIMVTSSDPDTLRDYNLDKQIDNLIPNCTAYSQALYECADEFDRLNGAKASQSKPSGGWRISCRPLRRSPKPLLPA